MNSRRMSKRMLTEFAAHLRSQEKSPITIEKYIRDAGGFLRFAGARAVNKELVLSYKSHLQESGYAIRSINSMLAAVNSLMEFLGWGDCRVKSIRVQRQTYLSREKELTKGEYLRLLRAAEGRPRLRLILETICATGIRVSELRYFTVEAVRQGEVFVCCKGKNRPILLPKKLKKVLLDYAKQNGIQRGILFRTRTGRPVDRSNLWTEMKLLCRRAGVEPGKVFPHNLRKLFARTFYSLDKDIARLADLLGHSSINTTRIYIMSTGTEHRRKLERMGLVV